MTLTPAQLEVLQLLADGWSLRDIARAQGAPHSTVAMRVHRAAARMGARSTTQAVVMAVGMGYIRWELPGGAAASG